MPDFLKEREQNRISIISHFKNQKLKNAVLDVGCGTGYYSIIPRVLGHRVHAFDISPSLIEKTFKRLSWAGIQEDIKELNSLGVMTTRELINPKIWKGDAGQTINFISGPYDTIFCLGGTFELLPDPSRSLALMLLNLSKGGKLFLEIENKQRFSYFFELLKDLFSRRVSLFEALRIFKGMRNDLPLELKRTIVGHSGKEHIIPFKILSLRAVQKIALKHQCKATAVEGREWLQEILGFDMRARGTLQTLLSRIPFFAKRAPIIWIEITKDA